jgi:hypothetical protein
LADAQSPVNASNLEVAVRSLKFDVEAIESLPAFDVAGFTTYREDFGDGKQPVVRTIRTKQPFALQGGRAAIFLRLEQFFMVDEMTRPSPVVAPLRRDTGDSINFLSIPFAFFE